MTDLVRTWNPSIPSRRRVLGLGASLAAFAAIPARAQAPVVRIGLPTKTYWPTIIAETAVRHKMFDREGVKAELTIYRGGAECFEALAAGAADLVLNSSSVVAAGIKKGVMAKIVANGANGYYGWHLMVRSDSRIQNVSELEGKKVGITSAGSGSDLLALWTQADRKVKFTRVPLGGGGLVPNLLSGNIDATVLYSPLTFQVMQSKEARSIVDFGEAVPAHSTGSWMVSEKVLKEKPEAIQKALNALYGGLAFLRAPANREVAVKLIAEIDEITPQVAAAELDGNIMKLSTDGEIRKEWMSRALEMAKIIGMTNLASVDEMYVTNFKPVPTKA